MSTPANCRNADFNGPEHVRLASIVQLLEYES